MKGPRSIVPPDSFVAHGLAPLAGAPLPLLTNHGGPVLGSVEVVPIYWGAAWSSGTNATLTAQLDGFFDFILTSSHMDLLSEYGTATTQIRHGRRIRSVHIAGNEPGSVTPTGRQVTDAQIQQAIQGWIADGTAPAITANTLYFVYLPPNVVSVMQDGSQSCSVFCGYHNAVGNLYYAVIPYVTCNGCVFPGDFLDTLTEVTSHELVEAITDPALDAWWDSSTGNEIGDICNRQTVRLGGYIIQTEWSNSQQACVIAPVATPPTVVEQHNLFRSADGHIHALWFNFTTGWHHEDRSTFLPDIPPAVGDPFGYAFVDGTVVEQHNLFRSADGHIHALWFNFATGWHHEDRSTFLTGIPPAVGDPFGYAFITGK